MVGERGQGGLQIADRLNSGKVFFDAFPPDNIVATGFAQEGNVHFDAVKLIKITDDSQHALVEGLDGHTSVLLRDSIPLLEASSTYGFKVVAETEDFSRLVVSRPTGKGSSDLILVEGPDRQTVLEVGQLRASLLWHSENLDDFWLSNSTLGFPKRTRFSRIKVLGKNLDQSRVQDFLSLKEFYEPMFLGINAAGSEILWKGVKPGEEYVYRNGRQVVSGEKVDVSTNPDLSAVMYVTYAVRILNRKHVSIYLENDGSDLKEVFSGGGGIRSVRADDDLSRVAVVVGTREGQEVIFFLVDGRYAKCDPVDIVTELHVEKDKPIVARVTRDNKKRTITVGKEPEIPQGSLPYYLEGPEAE